MTPAELNDAAARVMKWTPMLRRLPFPNDDICIADWNPAADRNHLAKFMACDAVRQFAVRDERDRAVCFAAGEQTADQDAWHTACIAVAAALEGLLRAMGEIE